MAAVQKGKDWVEEKKQQAIDAGKAGLGKVAEWLGIRKKFKVKDGKSHTLYFKGKGLETKLIMATTPTEIEVYLTDKKVIFTNALQRLIFFLMHNLG
jgi:hypothetical protein